MYLESFFMFGNKIIQLDSINSTNSYLKDLIKSENVQEGTIVCTKRQTAGRGQRGNVWNAESDKNLLLSFVLYPKFLTADRQFLLSKITALSVYDFLHIYLNNLSIKWPNDLYVNDLKIAGILIENTLSGMNIDNSIIGVGINVNQVDFDKSIPNPSSMSLQTGNTFNLNTLLDELCGKLNFWYKKMINSQLSDIDNNYINSLYRFGKQSDFKDKNGKFTATINGIDTLGRISMIDDMGKTRIYAFKEVAFLQNN